MGSSSFVTSEHSSPEVFPWLKTLPVAPEYHPTIQEFQDPIAYIFKIEKEASKYGICKIVPPVPPQSKKSVISNFNRSLQSLCSSNNQNPKSQPAFTTRQQQVGFCPRKQRPVQKSVWQSGEYYTLHQFEAKAKNFEKNYLKNRSKKTLSPLEVETLYWKAHGDRPFSVEYANDMAGSAFVPMKDKRTGEVVAGAATNVGDTAWNMRGVARANGSLLRFMKEEIPGVTSPMVYVAMMFSWFAWHVEDHDLHSLNYLHFGASKTWYGVPKDAASAFEEVIRVYGFGEEINPLVTFATLGEKTTVMSPEVLINAGVPCCRLVQNAGEFVVTFPRAYHSGFSHGFNCAEASNIATPEWLRFAKDAAIRRASINYPPMVSHFQLLYDLALAICSRVPTGSNVGPRSSRLKDKKKGEGEMLVKQMFVQDVMQNNELLSTLGQGSEVVLLPHNSSEKFVWSNLRVGSKYKVKPGLPFSLYSSEESIKASDDIMLARDGKQQKALSSVKTKFGGNMSTLPHDIQDSETEKGGGATGDGLADRGLFSCVKCGIWTFACVAIVRPTESAAQYLRSADCSSFFYDWTAGSGLSSQAIDAVEGEAHISDPDSFSGSMEKNAPEGLYDVPSHSDHNQAQSRDNTSEMKSNTAETIKVAGHTEIKKESSALGLLAMTYGNSSDSDEEDAQPNCPIVSEDNLSGDGSWGNRFHQNDSALPNFGQGYDSGVERGPSQISSRSECEDEDSPQRFNIYENCSHRRSNSDDNEFESHNCSAKFTDEDTLTSEQNYSPIADEHDTAKASCATDPVGKPNFSFAHGCDEDSSRMHVFCLEHAVEVEKLLRPIGGVHILLLCHPDYPNVEVEAKKVAEELEMDYVWKDVAFSVATKEDEERIHMALQSEEATPKNGDWAIKLGINLFYSAILSRSPLYNKQMPYNSVIYSAFGCSSPSKSSSEAKVHSKGFGRQKKLVMAGKWCGKVWMSNQVHPLLFRRDLDDYDIILHGLKSDEKVGRKSEPSLKAQTTHVNRKVGKKRKPISESKMAKKMKYEASEFANFDPEDSMDDEPDFESRRSVKKSKAQAQRRPIKRAKHREEMPDNMSEDSQDDVETHQGPLKSAKALKQGAKRVLKGAKGHHSLATIDSNSDEDSPDDGSNQPGLRSSNRKLKGEVKSTRRVKPRLTETLDSESEGLPSDESEPEEHRTTVRSPSSSRRRVPVYKQSEPVSEDDEVDGGPSSRLRKRISRPTMERKEMKPAVKRQVQNSKGKKAAPARKGPKMRLPVSRGPAMKGPARKNPSLSSADPNVDEEEEDDEAEFTCDIEGCSMSFGSKQELSLHKRNVCPVKGCGKKFFSHKYLVQHRRVHMDDRPLKCPWKGCRMTFKWAWARTEHIRVHTGARPYVCNEPGCGQTFRFVSDFSRHKRKTGHSAKKTRK